MMDDARAYLRRHHADRSPHMGGDLLAHLDGTAAILQGWGCDDGLCVSGLFHAVYGTESYRRALASPEKRQEIAALIGAGAEQLVWCFGRMSKESFYGSLPDGQPALTDRETGAPLPLGAASFSALCTLFAANWMEQKPRAGEKYAQHRADEFRLLRRWVGPAAQAHLDRSYGWERLSP